MFKSDRFNRSRQLLAQSVHVVSQDKTLLLFPLLSALGALGVILILFAPTLS